MSRGVARIENQFPGSGKVGHGCRGLGLAALLLATTVLAGPEEDYQAGFAANRAGDLVGAMVPLKRAADAGHAKAQALYGGILDQAELNEEALGYLRKAAAQGDADGQYALAVMLMAGEGTAKSPAEGARLLRAAAAQGHQSAIDVLAQAYIDGDERLGAADAQAPEARELVQKAALAGYLPAMDALAAAHKSGRFGFAVDPAAARKWADQASQVRAKTAASGKKS
ncbi:MAG: sel1 repeat family protein [Zoogloeaceae bacterium]|nr:sel1 repeat family protein [Zoogloeaceae bacterium]